MKLPIWKNTRESRWWSDGSWLKSMVNQSCTTYLNPKEAGRTNHSLTGTESNL